jgi:DNA-binding beta-propeller fold protein YncE
MRIRALLGTSLVAFVLMTGSAWGLTQLPGTAGCVSLHGEGGCAAGRAISEADGQPAISPDGRSAYLVADSRPEGIESDAIVVFDRDPATGALTQKPGAEGCLAASGELGCARDQKLNGARQAVVSPDGRNVYVSSEHGGVLAFARDASTGALTPLTGAAECIGGPLKAHCARAVGLEDPGGLTFSPDGAELYATNIHRPTVAILGRDPLTGKLSRRAGGAGCVTAVAQGGSCKTLGLRPGAVLSIVVPADGASAYALLIVEGLTSLQLFARHPDGTLQRTGGRTSCYHPTGSSGCPGGSGLREIDGLALSPDGTSLYVTSGFGFSSKAGAVTTFHRAGGALSQSPGTAGCISANGGECAVDKVLAGAEEIAVSPDGTDAYVTTLYGLAILDRDPTGALTVPPGKAACLSDFKKLCAPARNLEAPDGVGVSPDGKNVYVTSLEPGGVSVFDR